MSCLYVMVAFLYWEIMGLWNSSGCNWIHKNLSLISYSSPVCGYKGLNCGAWRHNPLSLSLSESLSFFQLLSCVSKSPSRLAFKVCYETAKHRSSISILHFNSFNGIANVLLNKFIVCLIDMWLFFFFLCLCPLHHRTIPFLRRALRWSYWSEFMSAI